MKSRKIAFTLLMALGLIGLTFVATAAASYDQPIAVQGTVELQGVADWVGSDDLVVAGVMVSVDAATEITEGTDSLALTGLEAGWTVRVAGPVLEGKTILADEVQVVSQEPLSDETQIELTGVIQEVGADSVVVAGFTVAVDATTEIKDGDESLELTDLEAGWTVKVEGVVLADGTIAAEEIKVVSRELVTPSPSPSITPTLTLTPTLTPTPTVPVTPTVTPTPQWQHPVALALANYFDVPYDEIMAWHEQGIGFGNISMAYSLAEALEDEGLTVEYILDERLSGIGWGQVVKALGLSPSRKGKNLGRVMSDRGDDDGSDENLTATDEPPGNAPGSPGKDKERDRVPPGQAKKDKGKGRP